MDNLRIPTELIAPAFNPASFADRDNVHALFTRLRRGLRMRPLGPTFPLA